MGEAQSSPPVLPLLADHPSQLLLLERAVDTWSLLDRLRMDSIA